MVNCVPLLVIVCTIMGTLIGDNLNTDVTKHLGDNTAALIEKIMYKFVGEIEDAENLLTVNIAAIENMAFEQLNGPLSQFNSKLETGKCILEDMSDFLPRLQMQLNQCTGDLSRLIEDLQQEKSDLNEAVKGYVEDIAAIPTTCQLHIFALFSNFNCYRKRLTDLVDVIAVQVNRLGAILKDTRQLAELGTSVATECARDIVNSTIRDLQYC